MMNISAESLRRLSFKDLTVMYATDSADIDNYFREKSSII